MGLRATLVIAGLCLATLAPAEAKDKRPQSTNPNVKRAQKKAMKGRKMKATKYKAPKKSKKSPRASYGVKHT
jgi:hypothetical protein